MEASIHLFALSSDENLTKAVPCKNHIVDNDNRLGYVLFYKPENPSFLSEITVTYLRMLRDFIQDQSCK